MYIQSVAFNSLSKPLYPILLLCYSYIVIKYFFSSFQIRFFSFWIYLLNRSHVRNYSSHVSDDSPQVSRVPPHVKYYSPQVSEVSPRVEYCSSRVIKDSSHVRDVKRNIILLKSRNISFLFNLFNQ